MENYKPGVSGGVGGGGGGGGTIGPSGGFSGGVGFFVFPTKYQITNPNITIAKMIKNKVILQFAI